MTASKPEPAVAPKPVAKPTSKDPFWSEDEEDSPLSTKVPPKPQEAGSKTVGGAPPEPDDSLFAEPPKKRPVGGVPIFGGVDLFGRTTLRNAGKGNSLKSDKKQDDDLNAQASSNKPSSPDDDLFPPLVAKKPVKKDDDLFAQPSGKSPDSTTADDQSTRRKSAKEESPSKDLFEDPFLGNRFPTKKIAPMSNAEAGKMREMFVKNITVDLSLLSFNSQLYLVMIRIEWLPDHLREL